MEKKTFAAGSKTVTLYPAEMPDAPLIVYNTFTGDGSDVADRLQALGAPAHHLLVVSGIDWYHDMSPWQCDALSKKEPPCTGGADAYLAVLQQEILPHALELLGGKPGFTGIAGYSLAGLFAVYALYQCDAFDRAASMSGSMWFPGFLDFVQTHTMQRTPAKLYLSVGDREARTRHPLLRTVQENTEQLAKIYRASGIDVTFALNPGNHFQEPDVRTAKGILDLLNKDRICR